MGVGVRLYRKEGEKKKKEGEKSPQNENRKKRARQKKKKGAKRGRGKKLPISALFFFFEKEGAYKIFRNLHASMKLSQKVVDLYKMGYGTLVQTF